MTSVDDINKYIVQCRFGFDSITRLDRLGPY
jgi:hypothetical protein